jgi:hypothetical protein
MPYHRRTVVKAVLGKKAQQKCCLAIRHEMDEFLDLHYIKQCSLGYQYYSEYYDDDLDYEYFFPGVVCCETSSMMDWLNCSGCGYCGIKFVHCDYCCGCTSDIRLSLGDDAAAKLRDLIIRFYETHYPSGQELVGECAGVWYSCQAMVDEIEEIYLHSDNTFWDYRELLHVAGYLGRDEIDYMNQQSQRPPRTLADFVDIDDQSGHASRATVRSVPASTAKEEEHVPDGSSLDDVDDEEEDTILFDDLNEAGSVSSWVVVDPNHS